MNRTGYLVLYMLLQNKATTMPSAMTLEEIVQSEDIRIMAVKKNTVHKMLKDFESKDYVCQGLKDGKAATYYITSAGGARLEEIRTSQIQK